MAPKLIFVEFLYIGVQIVQYEFDNKTARTVDFLFFMYCHTPYLVLKREHKVGIITVWVRVVVPKAAISLSPSLPPNCSYKQSFEKCTSSDFGADCMATLLRSKSLIKVEQLIIVDADLCYNGKSR